MINTEIKADHWKKSRVKMSIVFVSWYSEAQSIQLFCSRELSTSDISNVHRSPNAQLGQPKVSCALVVLHGVSLHVSLHLSSCDSSSRNPLHDFLNHSPFVLDAVAVAAIHSVTLSIPKPLVETLSGSMSYKMTSPSSQIVHISFC